MKNNHLGASKIQKLLYIALRDSEDLASESDDFAQQLLNDYTYTSEEFQQASSVIYREIYYRCAKDLELSTKESTLLEQVVRLLNIDDELV